MNTLGAIVVGFYVWLAGVNFGLNWLDTVYARLMPDATRAFSEVADFLLFITLITVVAGLGAVAMAWHSRTARVLLCASLAVGVVLPMLAMALLSPVLQDAPSSGAALRLMIYGSASFLAIAGFFLYARTPRAAPPPVVRGMRN